MAPPFRPSAPQPHRYTICKEVKEYDFLVNGDNQLPPEADIEWYQRVVKSFNGALGYPIDGASALVQRRS